MQPVMDRGVCVYTGWTRSSFLRDDRVLRLCIVRVLVFTLWLRFDTLDLRLRPFFCWSVALEAWFSPSSSTESWLRFAELSFRAGEGPCESCMCSKAPPGTVLSVWSCSETLGSLVSEGSGWGGAAGAPLRFSFLLVFLTFSGSASPDRRSFAAARTSMSCTVSAS